MIVEKRKEKKTEETEQKEGRARDEGECVGVCVGGGLLLLLVCLSGCH